MQRASDLIESKVYDLDGGKVVGKIVDLTFSLQTGAISGVFVRRPFKRPSVGFVPLKSINGFGKDAVTILSSDCVEEGVARPKGLLTKKLMTDSGNIVGKITDCIIARKDRMVVGLELSRSFWEDLKYNRKLWPLSPDFVMGDVIIAPENSRSLPPDKLVEHARRLAPFSERAENEEVCFLNGRD